MYIETVPNGKYKSAVLLRESFRDGKKVCKRTLANLSSLSPSIIENIKKALKGDCLLSQSELFSATEVQSTVPWGHVKAVLTAMERLGMGNLIDPVSTPERSVILGLVAARILDPNSKLSTVSWWKSCSLASELGLNDFNEDDAYQAMDWLLTRQSDIEKRLFSRHVHDGDMLFLDMSSTYYEGEKSSLVSGGKLDAGDAGGQFTLIRRGYSRDKKRGMPQINFAMLADKEGHPLSITVFPGNTSDSSVFLPTVKKIREEFGISKAVLVGDRGMISSKDITILKSNGEIDWITALRSSSIKSLLPKGYFQFSLFDEYELCEFTAPEFPGERLAACRNPELRKKREATRNSMIEATKKDLDKIKARVESGRLKVKEKIGEAVGRVINKYNMKKHFFININDSYIDYSLNISSINAEKALDGVYIIRTSLPVDAISVEECVRQYKNLSQVENAFRTMKTVDLRVRPIFHHLDDRIRAHIFLTMLSYYVEWHMREVWRELTFSDTELELKKERNPVAPAKRSAKAVKKAASKMVDSNIQARQFRGVLSELGAISDVVISFKPSNGEAVQFSRRPDLNPLQRKALGLLQNIPMYP
jgi:transposase